LFNPVIVKFVAVEVAVCPPGLAVTVYKIIGDPPFEAGADQETLTLPFPIVPATLVGASGTVAGVTELLVEDGVLVPTAFVAVTVKV
jgi:hypothetical protein